MGKPKEVKDLNKANANQRDILFNKQQQDTNRYLGDITGAEGRAASERDAITSGIGNLTNIGNSFLGTNIRANTGALSGDAADYRNFAHGQGETGDFFRNLMNTGGYTQGELGDIRSAGNRQIPSFFANLRDRMQTAQNATGGYSPGYSSGMAALARDMAHKGQEAALDTELGISDRVRQGKLTGAEALNQMFLGGMGGATEADKAIMAGQLQAAGLSLQGQGIGASLLGRANDNLMGLYTSRPGEASMYEGLYQGAAGQNASDINANIGQGMQYNPNQSWFDRYGMPILSGGLGIASGLWSPTRRNAASTAGRYPGGGYYSGGNYVGE
jgi:hypothetical protein